MISESINNSQINLNRVPSWRYMKAMRRTNSCLQGENSKKKCIYDFTT